MLALILGVAGCGSSKSPADATSPLSSTTSDSTPPVPQPSATSPPPFQPVLIFHAGANQSDGTSEAYTLGLGTKSDVSHPLTYSGFDGLQSACQTDPQRDVQIPFQLRVTNTTKRFATSPSPLLGIGDPSSGATTTVEMAYTQSGGAQCTTSNDGGESESGSLLLQFNDLASGASGLVDGIIIVRNYYSPQEPNGDPTTLNRIHGSFARVNCFDGPGSFRGVFALDGSPVAHYGIDQLTTPDHAC